MGRPTKLTPEVSEAIGQNLTAGMQRSDAAELAGISPATFADWMARGAAGEERYEEFRQKVIEAELLAQRRLVGSLTLAAGSDPKVAQWLLERRHSRSWAEKGHGGPLIPLLPEAPVDQKAQSSTEYPPLPWENADEHQELLRRLVAEHAPQGTTEHHLVEELAGILLRKRRLHAAEAASHRRALGGTLKPYRATVDAALAHVTAEEHRDWVGEAIHTAEDETKKEQAELDKVGAITRRALETLNKGGADAYEKAMAALAPPTREWWGEESQKAPKGTTPGAAGLKRFIEHEVLPSLASRDQELWSRPLIREQAFGDAFDAKQLETLGRIEGYLDRKLERTLATLRRLQEQRRSQTD